MASAVADHAAMDETISLLKAVEDAVEREAFETAADGLKRLLSVRMSLAILQKSRAGVKAAKLRDHSDAKLAAAARECVKAWKKLAEEQGAVRTASASSASALTPSSSAHSAGSSAEAASSGSTAPVAAVHPSSSAVSSASSHSSSSSSSPRASAPAPASASAVPAPVRLSVTRQRVKDMMQKMLSDVVLAYIKTDEGQKDVASICGGSVPDASLLAERCDRVCGEVEEALFEALAGADHDRPSTAYGEQFKMLAMNLRRNVQLSVNIFFGFVRPTALPRMTSEDLISDKERAAADKARSDRLEATQLDWQTKNKAKLMASAGVKTGEGTLTCGKCKGKNTEYTQKQTRSADEPMTTFALCNDCGHRWKFC